MTMAKTVLITGGSGFIAAHLLDAFLEAGYHVRATVRSPRSADKVRTTHGKYGDALSFSIVPEISEDGAFDEAVKGVDGVVHSASPFILNAEDYDRDLFEPAKKGTVNILKAVKANNPNVKRVVITSSFADMLDVTKGLRPGYTYSEADWNPMTTDEAQKAGPAAAYLVSKTIAERAAYDFVKNEKPNFTISTVSPPMVYGPIRHAVESTGKLNTSLADIFRLYNGTEKQVPETSFWAFADVRDLAQAHLKAFESDKAANQRYLVSNGTFGYQNFVDIIRDYYPDLRDGTPEGDAHSNLPPVYKLDVSKSVNDLGMKYRTMEETVVDAVNSLRKLEKATAA